MVPSEIGVQEPSLSLEPLSPEALGGPYEYAAGLSEKGLATHLARALDLGSSLFFVGDRIRALKLGRWASGQVRGHHGDSVDLVGGECFPALWPGPSQRCACSLPAIPVRL